jgi:hypothetical protein
MSDLKVPTYFTQICHREPSAAIPAVQSRFHRRDCDLR